MNTIVTISGLGRSGTTILDLLLGTFFNTIGLGETFPLLRDFDDYWQKREEIECSCGNKVNKCSFWSPIGEDILKRSSVVDRYRTLTNYFFFQNPDRILVDSSGNPDKRQNFINYCLQSSSLEIKSLMLTRDARAWTLSMQKADQRYRKQGIRTRRVPTFIYLLRWYLRNRQIMAYLKRNAIPTITTGYERLIFSPYETINDIANFINRPAPENVDLSDSKSHIITGNRIKGSPKDRQTLTYDPAWLTNYQSSFFLAIMPFAKNLNTKLVYEAPKVLS